MHTFLDPAKWETGFVSHDKEMMTLDVEENDSHLRMDLARGEQ